MVFINNLDNEINILQIKEQFKYDYEQIHKKVNETFFTSGAIVAGIASTIVLDNHLYIIICLSVVGAVKLSSKAISLHKIAKYRQELTEAFRTNDYLAIKRGKKKINNEKGNYEIASAQTFYRNDPEEIEEEIDTFTLKGPIEMAIFNEEETKERLLYEYDAYNKKYNLPKLNTSEQELSIIVSSIGESLTNIGLPHRLYTYLSEYFKIVIVSSMINYEEEITINDFINRLNFLEYMDFPEEEISKIKETIISKINELKNCYKLTKNKK